MNLATRTTDSFWDCHGLRLVMLIAVLLRAIATIFSKGYMASDDHFQTISVAYTWLQSGMFNGDGCLTWLLVPSSDISRFPLYTLFIYAVMWIYKMVGISSLDTIMYGIRAVHAAISLIGVWAVYRTVFVSTRSSRWASLGGLIMAAHFAMPFLSVRNLIEMVGGALWALALYCLYRHRDSPSPSMLLLAGLISGLAWAIRFQLAFAIAVVPIVMLFEHHRVRPALAYAGGVATILLAAGLADWWLMGKFMGTSLNYLAQSLSEGALYSTPLLIYIGVILGLFLPPMSIIFFVPVFLRTFCRRHRILIISTVMFVLVHAFAGNRQERFMLPVFPALVLMIVMAWHQVTTQKLFSAGFRQVAYAGAIIAVGINLLLLIPFTANYGHRGMVGPLVEISNRREDPSVVFVTPEASRFFPLDYGDRSGIQRRYLKSWQDLAVTVADTAFLRSVDYFIVYPDKEDNLQRFLDSLTLYFGPLQPEFEVMPSPLDRLLHIMNPDHNDLEAAWIYSPVR